MMDPSNLALFLGSMSAEDMANLPLPTLSFHQLRCALQTLGIEIVQVCLIDPSITP
jgi:hypothetical protein